MNYDFQGQWNLSKSTLTFLVLWNCQKCFFGKRWVNYKKIPGKMKKIYLNLYKLTLSQLFFDGFLRVNSKSTYIMNIFLRLWKTIPIFLSLISFSILVMNISMEKLSVAKFSAAFYDDDELFLWYGWPTRGF